jgi:hypothetical protein
MSGMRALSVPFRITGTKIGSTSEYTEIVRGQVIDALMTNQGERVFRPLYGCDIQAALFDPSDELSRYDAAAIITERLRNLVPRCTIRYVLIELNAESQVDIKISYQASSVTGEATLNIPLSLFPGWEFERRSLPGQIEQLYSNTPAEPL